MQQNEHLAMASIWSPFAAAAACLRNFRSESGWTPRSFSMGTYPSSTPRIVYGRGGFLEPMRRTLHLASLKGSCHKSASVRFMADLTTTLTANVNGLCSNTKQSELSVLLNTHHIDAAVITETHLNENIDDRRVLQPGYNSLRRDRRFKAVNKSRGGGVIIYLKEDISFVQPNVQVPDELEVCWVILRPSQADSLIVAGVYLPPDACAAHRQMLTDHLVTTVDLFRSSRPSRGGGLYTDGGATATPT